MQDGQRGDRTGEADVEAAQAGAFVGLAGHDPGRLHQDHVVELEAFRQGRGYDVQMRVDVVLVAQHGEGDSLVLQGVPGRR